MEDSTEVIEEIEEEMETVRAAIHMDAMAFGMGCCCLQITFQAKDMDESRFMYDQLAVMAPIMMALTASTPIMKGRIADTDARWGIISESVDDRTLAERGRPDANAPYDELAGKGQRRIYKSRYDSISTYIYQGSTCENANLSVKNDLANRVLNSYNDIPVPIDEDVYKELRDAGIDPALSQHVAHLYIRDPLVIFDGAVEELDDETQTEHFESIQSTNW
jgi:glutamate--cysteine ligase catalytic subunit